MGGTALPRAFLPLVLAFALASPPAAAVAAAGAAVGAILIDDFEDVSAWTAHPSEGVNLDLGSDAGAHGRALRLDVRFARGTGYAVARRAVSLDLPPDYVFRFRLRGDIPVNHLEFKLVDSTGQNVWWHVRRDLEYPREWRVMSSRKRQIRFGWGPAGGGEIRHVAFIEFAVTAGEGGAGSVWLDDLVIEPLPPDSLLPPVRARASSQARGGEASRAVDGDQRSGWTSGRGDRLPWIEFDLGRPREFGGLELRWAPGRHLADYVVETSADGQSWTGADTVRGGNGGLDPLYLPESEARLVRARALRAPKTPAELREATIEPLEWSATPEAFFTNLARESPRGTYPRPYVGEQCAWAVVGPDAAREEALLSEDGMLETGRGQYSIEPFLEVSGKLISWADVRTSQSMNWGRLPVPSVGWGFDDFDFAITAAALGDSAEPYVGVQYHFRNLGIRPRNATLYLAVRPFQVNPPWQNIGSRGGTARVNRIGRDKDFVRVNGAGGFVCYPSPSRFAATSLSQGEIIERLRDGRLPAANSAEDRDGFASAVVMFEYRMPPKSSRDVHVLVPLRLLPDSTIRRWRPPWQPGAAEGDVAGGIVGDLPQSLRKMSFVIPPGHEVDNTVDAQLGWILVNRDGGAIQPGSRNYDRSWIRDGSLTSSALLRMGHPEVVRDFIEWFAPFQYDNGKIPCCASDRGPDPVTENDSHGEFIWLIAEYYRYTGDRPMVERMWPRVTAAVAHMDSLRAQRRTAEFRTTDKRKFFGLLLPSISHEGYPNPMHSYWDDFFAYRGYVDAAYLAGVLGRAADRTRFAAARDVFAHDLAASIAAAMGEKHIDYIPGCAELGDFDATSTTVALTPTGAADLLPDAAVRATFERYWKFFSDRRDGRLSWEAFTPYEMRTIGSFVRLGWRDRADSALTWFMEYRQPAGWRQWGEVAYRDPRAPKYIGDLPHTWVGSDFVRSVLDMLAYERGRDSSLVIAAGVPWRSIEKDQVVVNGLRTPFGQLSYLMLARSDTVEVSIGTGTGLLPAHIVIPPGGIVVIPPSRRPFRSAVVNGAMAPITAEGAVVVRTLPARIEMRP